MAWKSKINFIKILDITLLPRSFASKAYDFTASLLPVNSFSIHQMSLLFSLTILSILFSLLHLNFPNVSSHIQLVLEDYVLKKMVIVYPSNAGFPTGVANMGSTGESSSKFDVGGGGLSQNMAGAWGKLKMLSKNTCEGVHLIVKLPAISLQASKFTKYELLHTYFSRILARF